MTGEQLTQSWTECDVETVSTLCSYLIIAAIKNINEFSFLSALASNEVSLSNKCDAGLSLDFEF